MSFPGYPQNDLDNGRQLLQQLGSFWNMIFDGNGKLQSLMHGNAQEQAQAYLDFLESVATLSRFDIPVFHTENWYLLTIKLSEVTGLPSVYKAGDLVYGPQLGTVPDRPAGFTQTYAGQDNPLIVKVKLPDLLVDAPFTIQNTILVPSRVLVKDLDYDIDTDRQVISFHSNPFQDTAIPHRDVFDDAGTRVDEEIALWVYRGSVDLDYIYNHFGYVLGLQLKSSENYKALLNAFWDMHLLGPSKEQFEVFMSALSGAPMILDPTETVEVVQTEADSILIVTNTRVYRAALTANVVVSVGDVLHAGDPITDAVRIEELTGDSPDFSILPALALSKNFLSGDYLSELTVRNQTVSLEYDGLDADGKAFVKFEVSGFPGDVDKFWNDAQTRGKESGNKTLAEMLDTRVNPTTQPTPSNLPATVNPLEFMVENLLGNNLFVIRVRQASFTAGAPGVEMFRLLRRVIPPHTTYIVFIELGTLYDEVDLGLPGSVTEAGATESAGVFFSAGPIVEEAYEEGSSPGGNVMTYGDVSVSAKLYSLTCQ